MPTDPKWRSIARKSGQPLTTVIAVFNFVLVNASGNDDERGTLKNWVSDDVAAALDITEEEVDLIIQAMQGKVLDGVKITGWDSRQPKREDGGAERAREWRDKKKQEANAPERTRTQPSAEKRSEEEEEKSRKTTNPEPDTSAVVSSEESQAETKPRVSSPDPNRTDRTVLQFDRGWQEFFDVCERVGAVSSDTERVVLQTVVWPRMGFEDQIAAANTMKRREQSGEYRPGVSPTMDNYLRKRLFTRADRPPMDSGPRRNADVAPSYTATAKRKTGTDFL